MTAPVREITTKNCGAEFLEDLPARWEIRPAVSVARVLTSNVDKNSVPGQVRVHLCNYTDVYYSDEVVAGGDFMLATASKEQARTLAVRAGDVAITKDSETADDIGISAYVPRSIPDLVYGYHLAIYRPHDIRYGKFLKWVFDSSYAKAYFATRTFGVTRVGLSQNALRYFRIPTPPPEEAKAISDYLDVETAEIDAFIRDQRDLIRLLEERRGSLISDAVRRGLDPTVPTKDSGVVSIGNIPTDWSVAEVRHVFKVLDCKHVTAEFVPDGDFPVASIRQVGGTYVSLDHAKRTSERYFRTLTEGGRQPRPFDLILSRNATIGQSSLVPDGLGDFALGQDVSLIRDGLQQNRTTFLRYVMQSTVGADAFATAAIGSTFKRVNVDDIKSIRFALPPIDQLRAIVQFLDAATAEIDAAVADVGEAIGLMRERRSALISAAVTGKIDVRERAKGA